VERANDAIGCAGGASTFFRIFAETLSDCLRKYVVVRLRPRVSGGVLRSAGDMPAPTATAHSIYPHEMVPIPLLIRAASMEIFGLPAHPSLIRRLAFLPVHGNSDRRQVERVVLNAFAKSPRLCRLIPAFSDPSAIAFGEVDPPAPRPWRAKVSHITDLTPGSAIPGLQLITSPITDHSGIRD